MSGFTSAITIDSSSKSSSSCATPVSKLVDILDKKCIASCVIGLSSLNRFSPYYKNLVHSALLLIDTNSEIENKDRGKGILIEFGDYSPKMNDKENEYTKNKYVIYHYKDKGGLRYYVKEYREFIKEFGDIGYMSLDLEDNSLISFSEFLKKCDSKKEELWTQDKYDLINNNCQTFTAYALTQLKVIYSKRYITFGKNTDLNKEKESIVPKCILNVLKNFK